MDNTRYNQHRHKILVLLLLYIIRKKKIKTLKSRRKYWIHPILRLKQQQGEWYNLIQEMRLLGDETFFSYMRMTSSTFDNLLEKVGPSITKLETNCRIPIPASVRLAMTIRYLASGDGLQTIAFNYRVGRSTTSKIIRKTCEAIWDNLYKEVLFTPTQDGWRDIAQEFQERWDFPNCIGALDGKHVRIICPQKAGSLYYNYKSFYSIVLMALVSAKYQFLIVDIGAQGKHSDGGVFKNSAMGQQFYNNLMDLPDSSAISGRHIVPYVIAADEAFQLTEFTMRPYPSKNLRKEQKIFNYRLSRARHVVENAFGILTSRWRIYQKSINTNLETADNIIKATVCLHNFLMNTLEYCGEMYADRISANGDIIEGEWRKNIDIEHLKNVTNCGSNNYTRNSAEIRNTFTDYFLHEGKLSWQEEKI